MRHGFEVKKLFAPLMAFDRIGLAVSGGPDSLGLMLLAAGWAGTEGKTLVVYTVNHGLRPEAAAECALVAVEAQRLGLVCRMLAWDGTKPASGIQAAARAARYRLIGAAMREDGSQILVTAHHRNDQAETILMRMAHGSGVSGLCGMTLFGEVEGVRLCRPMLGVEPARLRDIVRDAGLIAVADPSNMDEHYERVRWRHTLPILAREGLDAERLASLAKRMARADAALDRAAGEAIGRLASVDRFGVVSIPHGDLFALAEEIGLRLIDRMVGWAGGGSEPCRLGTLESAYEALAAAAPGHATTLGGAAMVRDKDTVLAFRELGRMPAPAAISLESAGNMAFDGRFTIACSGSGAGLSVSAAGEEVTRAAAEALAGPIAAPMRAVASAPALRDRDGRLVGIGVGTYEIGNARVSIAASFGSKPPQTGQ